MNYPSVQKKRRNKVVTNRYPRLSDLNIDIILDHAGGHDSSACRRELVQLPQRSNRRHRNNNVRMVESNSRPFLKTNPAMEKILSHSPITKKHDKKLYIHLNDNPSQAAMTRRETTWINKGDSVRLSLLPKSPLFDKLRQSTSSAFPTVKAQRRRRYSTGSMPSLTVKPPNMQDSRQENCVSSPLLSRQRQGKLKPRRSFSMSYYFRQEEKVLLQPHGDSPIRNDNKHQSRRSKKRMDSPAGSFQRIPKGYIPLFPDPFDLTSETSCSTHSSSLNFI